MKATLMNTYELRDKVAAALALPVWTWCLAWLVVDSRQATEFLPFSAGLAAVLIVKHTAGRLIESLTDDS